MGCPSWQQNESDSDFFDLFRHFSDTHQMEIQILVNRKTLDSDTKKTSFESKSSKVHSVWKLTLKSLIFDFVTFRNHFGTIWDHLIPSWDHFETNAESVKDHFGTILRPLVHQFGTILDQFGTN